MTDHRLDIHVDRSVAQTCARAGKGEQMGAEDKGGRRREGAGYLDLVDILLLLLIGGSHRVQFRVNSAIKAQVDLTTGQD